MTVIYLDKVVLLKREEEVLKRLDVLMPQSNKLALRLPMVLNVLGKMDHAHKNPVLI